MVKIISSVLLSKSFLSFLEIRLLWSLFLPEKPFFDEINFLRKMFCFEDMWIVCVNEDAEENSIICMCTMIVQYLMSF